MAPPDPARPGLDLPPDRWPEVSRLFAAAVGLDAPARNDLLVAACPDDPRLRAAVDSMLAAHDEAGAFGDAPMPEVASARCRLRPGTHLGSYRIENLIGVGGMGEVYRAHDLRLGRDVALKVLPDAVATDPDRLARFHEESRALAALNHPSVGAIYGMEEQSDVAALVLEFVDGQTLHERLAAGPLAADEIVGLARQMAEGLEAAHDRGIVHRDLKPGNVKITAQGSVKILDFGLAKAEGSAVKDPSIDPASPSRSRLATRAGLIVGTAAYMSPEQAKGQPVDKRTDIWAFGCVLFEMCAGTPAFSGATTSETLRAVVDGEPDWTALSERTPQQLVRLVRRCLTKDSRQRLRDIGEARIALSGEAEAGEVRHVRGTRRGSALAAGAGAVALVAAVGLVLYRPTPIPSTPIAAPARFEVPPPPGSRYQLHPARPAFALSPDGTRLAFVTDSGPGSRVPRIWLRAIASLEAQPVPGTEGAFGVVWSPDGRSLAFFTDDALKRVDLPGGPAVTVSALNQTRFSHASWGAQNEILIGTGSGTEIRSVPAAGGVPRVVVEANRANGEVRVHWPWFLPDGKRFLYTARLDDGEGELRVWRPDGSTRPLMRISSNAQWVDPDIVVFAREGVLLGQRVDLGAPRPVGEPFVIADAVDYFFTTSRALFSVSRAGTLAYHRGGGLQQLQWVDGGGREAGTVGAPADYHEQSTRLSRDGHRLLVARTQAGLGTYDLWRLDLVRHTEQRLTTSRGSDFSPVWTGDERSIFYAADSPGSVPHLFRMDLTTGVSTEVLPAGLQQNPMDVLPGDRALVFAAATDRGGFDIFNLPLAPTGPPVPLIESAPHTRTARVSPDGRAVAYISEGEGRLDIYVAPVPVSTAPELVAQGVAGPPRWSADGRFLYFISADGSLMRLPVRTAPHLTVGVADARFMVQPPGSSLVVVSPDGRFLLSVPHVQAAERPIVVATAAFGPRT